MRKRTARRIKKAAPPKRVRTRKSGLTRKQETAITEARSWYQAQRDAAAEYDVPVAADRYDPQGGWQGEEYFEELDVEFPTKEELADYFEALAETLDLDVSDLWRMYYGYAPKAVA